MDITELRAFNRALTRAVDPKKAAFFPRFFKTGKGEYGEGDVFLGITVPKCRQIATQFRHASFPQLQALLNADAHERRLIALLILVQSYQDAIKHKNSKLMEAIVSFYLKNTKRVNNWDLVDLSSHHILGAFLESQEHPPHEILTHLARSRILWERRIAMVSTYAFIRKNKHTEAIRIATMLLGDQHDLMHKASGWMLREIGKRDQNELRKFLDLHARTMPRTMLRYALEKFDDNTRKRYLAMAKHH